MGERLTRRGTMPISLADRMASGRFRVVDGTERMDPTDVIPIHALPREGDAGPVSLASAPTEPAGPIALQRDVPTDAERLGAAAQEKPQAAVARVPSKEPAPRELEPGDVFHGYTVVKYFDEGGLSVLYEATHPKHATPVLIKLLKPAYRRREALMIQAKLVAEGRLLQSVEGLKLELVRCFEVGMDERLGPWIVLEKLEGKTLYAHISAHLARGRTYDPRAAVTLCITVCEALHTMHRLGAVHRDIKPANIFLVEKDGKVVGLVVIDWGAAKSPVGPDTSLENETLGTLAYMPPEMIKRDGAITGAVDQYAVGFMLLEMLHRHPFRGKAEVNSVTLMHGHLAEPVEQPPTSFVPPRLWEVIKPSVEKNSDQRYASCGAFAQALRDWLQDPDERTQRDPKRAAVVLLPTVPKSGAAKPGRTPLTPPIETAKKTPQLALAQTCELPTIIVRSGPQAGERYVAEGSVVVGRHEAFCNLVLHEPGISQRHARLEPVEYGPNVVFTLTDLESQNGTSAGGVRLSDGIDFDDHLPPVGVLGPGSTFVLDTVELVLMPPGRLSATGGWQTPAEAEAEDAEHVASAARAAAKPVEVTREGRTVEKTAPEPAPPAPQKPKPKLLRQAHQFKVDARMLIPTVLVTRGKLISRHMLGIHGVIGSASERAHITVADPRVSGAHCRYTRILGGFGADVTYLFEDLGSTNGMWTGAGTDRTAVRALALKSGETVHLGATAELMLLAPGHFDAEWQYHLLDGRGGPYVPEAELPSQAATEREPRKAVPALFTKWLRAKWLRVALPRWNPTAAGKVLIVLLLVLAVVLVLVAARQRGWM